MKKSSFKLGSLGVAGMVLVSQVSTVAFADENDKKVFDVDRTRFEKLSAKAKELGIELVISDIKKDVPTVKDAKELQSVAQADLDSQLDKLEKLLNAYVSQKEAYDKQLEAAKSKLEELKKHEGEEGHLSQTLLQNLIFTSEPNAKLELETNGNEVSDKNVGLSDELSVNSKSVKFVNDKKVVATYTGLENSSYAGKKIAKVVYTFEKAHPENEMELNVLQDPTLGVNFNAVKPYQDLKMTVTFYNDKDEPIEFSEDKPALIGLSSITTNQIGEDGTKFYRETIKDYNFKFIPITGSSVTEQADGIYSIKDNKFKGYGAKYEHSETDFTSSPLFWYLGGAGELKSDAQIKLTLASTVETHTQYWTTFNGKVPTEVATVPPTEPLFEVDAVGTIRVAKYEVKLHTIWVTVNGKVLKEQVDGTKDKEDFTGYTYVKTEVDEDGNTKHIYDNTTKWITENGKELRGVEVGVKEKDSFNGYSFVKTETDEYGNVTHIYKQVSKITTYVDESGKELLPKKEGIHEKEKINGYEFVKTVTKENGDVEHVYKQVSKITTYVDESGKELLPKKEGIHEKEKINGYGFVKTVTKENGDVEHVYKQVSKVTTYVDESGKELLPKKEGIHEKEKINGYEYVKTVTKDNGNVEHVYKKVTEKKLPNTSVGIFGGIAGLLGLTGVGAYFGSRKRKK